MQPLQESKSTSLSRGSKIFPDIANSTPGHVLCVPVHHLFSSFIGSTWKSGNYWNGGSYDQVYRPAATMERVLNNYAEGGG